jgi:hypothetical protein
MQQHHELLDGLSSAGGGGLFRRRRKRSEVDCPITQYLLITVIFIFPLMINTLFA